MKNLLIYLFLTTYSLSLSAQGHINKDSILASKIGQVTINAGAGGSLIYWLEEGILGGTGYTNTTMSPVASLIADYRCTPRSSIGLAVAFQSTTGTPGDGDENTFGNGNYTEYITRTNVAFRYLVHFGKSDDFDFYMGPRIGASFWTDYVGGFPNFPFPAMYNDLVRFSFQFLMGFQVYFASFFGIHIEAAVGSPYFAEGGFTFRIKTKVKPYVAGETGSKTERKVEPPYESIDGNY